MQYILLGCTAFFIFIIFDLNKMYSVNRLLNACFALGIILLTIATAGILLMSEIRFQLPLPIRIVCGFLSAYALVMQFYCIFFAIPFKVTYLEGSNDNKMTVTSEGPFMLSRHPGVPWLFFFYIFLWLTSGIDLILWAGMIWTFFNVLHVYVQDRWLFPKYFAGYETYKLDVPFMLPNKHSLTRYIDSLKRGRSDESRQET
jgi:protein-S-isoprenylcysteine O-methyltransferase Ste14